MGWMFGHSAHLNSTEQSSGLHRNECSVADGPLGAIQDQWILPRSLIGSSRKMLCFALPRNVTSTIA